jgi:nucleoside phosphorylase
VSRRLELALLRPRARQICVEAIEHPPASLLEVRVHLDHLWDCIGNEFEQPHSDWRISRAGPRWLARRRPSTHAAREALDGDQLALAIRTSPEAITSQERKVVLGILSIREDEFAAVLERFPDHHVFNGRHRLYELTDVSAGNLRIRAVLFRASAQGTGPAQDAVRDLVEDLDPDLILLCGIGGGLPATDYTLGDVVLATSVADLRVKAVLQDGILEYATHGTPVHKSVSVYLAQWPAIRSRIATWSLPESIRAERPEMNLDSATLYGTPHWRAQVRRSLKAHFSPPARDRPIAITGAIASSDDLIKDADRAEATKAFVRDILAFEMEAAGAFEAADRRPRSYPVLVMRGISDIVGLKRDQAWTQYACHSAASLMHELVVSGEIGLLLP